MLLWTINCVEFYNYVVWNRVVEPMYLQAKLKYSPKQHVIIKIDTINLWEEA